MTRSMTKCGMRWTTALAASFVTLAAVGANGAVAADTGSRTVTGGSLEWGVKASFRNYMTGPIAAGTITPSAGAAVDSAFVAKFVGGAGELSADGTTHWAYKGAVHYYGHGGELDFTLSNPYVMVDKNGVGSIYMDYAVGKSAAKKVKMADLSGSAPAVSGNIATVSNASAKLTEQGVEVFSYKGNGFYPAGTALDPVSANANLAAAAPAPKPTDPAPTDPAPTTPDTTTPTSPAPAALSVATAGEKQTGQTTYAWGKLTGATNPAKVCTQFLVKGAWSQSQCAMTKSDGSYAIPLTYGATTPGTYSVRVVSGSTSSRAATLTRVASPSVSIVTAGTKKAGQRTYAWGALKNGSNPTPVCTQFLLKGTWSQSQCGMTAVDGSYAIPLTYGATTPGTYSVRVVAGSIASPTAKLVRTR